MSDSDIDDDFFDAIDVPSKLEIQDESDARPLAALKPIVAKPDTDESVRHKYALSTTQDKTSFEYNMNHKHRGVAVIFNHFEFHDPCLNKRRGTDKDVEALREALQLLGFESDNIVVKDDLTKSQILCNSYKMQAKKTTVLKDCDCIAIFILSHGSEENKIYARDGDYNLYDMVNQYKPHSFKKLAAKPKLFFVNAFCGEGVGSKGQCEFIDLVQSVGHQEVFSHSLDADIFISVSSTSKCFLTEEGSWYIQDLCKVIKILSNENKLDTTEITELLTRTHNLVLQRESSSEEFRDNNKKQTPNFNSTLCRSLYFKTKQ